MRRCRNLGEKILDVRGTVVPAQEVKATRIPRRTTTWRVPLARDCSRAGSSSVRKACDFPWAWDQEPWRSRRKTGRWRESGTGCSSLPSYWPLDRSCCPSGLGSCRTPLPQVAPSESWWKLTRLFFLSFITFVLFVPWYLSKIQEDFNEPIKKHESKLYTFTIRELTIVFQRKTARRWLENLVDRRWMVQRKLAAARLVLSLRFSRTYCHCFHEGKGTRAKHARNETRWKKICKLGPRSHRTFTPTLSV